jgi:hypothetical protein
MKPSGTSSFDDDGDDVPGSLPNTRVEPSDTPAREKPITAQRAGSMARTTKVYPQQEGTVYPRELLEFAIDAAREGYVRTANMGAAFNMMKRQLKDRWTVEKGPSGYVFKEHIHPLEAYLRPGVQHEGTHKGPPPPPEKPAAPESEAVADARKRWDAAKTSGDAGAMTRTANDLLRAVEADRPSSGEPAPAQTEGGRHPASEVLAPEGSHDSGSPESSAIASAAGYAVATAARAGTEGMFASSSVGNAGPEHSHAAPDGDDTTVVPADEAEPSPPDLDREEASGSVRTLPNRPDDDRGEVVELVKRERGRVKFEKLYDDRVRENRQWHEVTFGTIRTDNDRPIVARRNRGRERRMDTNCFGYVFANGEVWIDPQVDEEGQTRPTDQIAIILEDDYEPVRDGARVGDVVIYRDREGKPVHAAVITSITVVNGRPRIRVRGKRGTLDEGPIETDIDKQWPGADPENRFPHLRDRRYRWEFHRRRR